MKIKYSGFLFGYLFYFLTVPARSNAQSFDEIKKQYGLEHAVLLKNALHYNISIKEGKPFVESNEIEQIQYLSADASKYMSSYGFYHSDFQQLISYDAYTRTTGDKKLKVTDFKTKSSSEDFVFYDDSKETTFNFPDVEEGAIGNLEVSWENKNPYLLTPFYFERGIPVLKSEIKITFPKDMNIKYRLLGIDSAQVTLKVEKSHRENSYTFTYNNCPSLRRYNDAPGSSWFATHLVFYIESYKDENGMTVDYLSNLDDLYKLNYSYIKSVNAVTSTELKHIVDSLNAGARTAEEKAKNIYSWVQQHIKYVAFEQGMEGFIPRDASLVCARRFGDCKDMSSILKIMMEYAGIQSYFTWIGTRDLAYNFSDLPLPLVSNHMICTIKLNGKYIFLDGTDPNCVFGFPSWAIQDKEAMISINEKEYKILRVPIVDKSENTETDSTWLELTATGIRGKVTKYLTGYFSDNARGSLTYISQSNLKQDMKESFRRGSNKFQLDSIHISTPSNPDSTVFRASFTLPDYAKKLGDEWYLNLNLFKFYTDEEIDYPKRKMPIEYNFKFVKKFVTLLKIPDGYQVESLPQGKSFHNKVWGFDLTYEQKGNWLILTQQFDNDHLQITGDQFEAWNKVLENLYPLYKETVSLTKSNIK
jgi:hypothetical protein